MADHAAAIERANKMVAKPKMFKRENLELAAAYLELTAKLEAVKRSVELHYERAERAESALAKVFALLRRWVDYDTKAAGMTEEIVRDKDKFTAFLDNIESNNAELLNESIRALSAKETAAPVRPIVTNDLTGQPDDRAAAISPTNPINPNYAAYEQPAAAPVETLGIIEVERWIYVLANFGEAVKTSTVIGWLKLLENRSNQLEHDLTRLRTGIQAIAKRIRNEGMQGVANELEELGK